MGGPQYRPQLLITPLWKQLSILWCTLYNRYRFFGHQITDWESTSFVKIISAPALACKTNRGQHSQSMQFVKISVLWIPVKILSRIRILLLIWKLIKFWILVQDLVGIQSDMLYTFFLNHAK